MARYIDADKIDYTVTMVGMDENAGFRSVAFERDIDRIPPPMLYRGARLRGRSLRRSRKLLILMK